MELHDQLDAFEALNADIVAIAQRESDPSTLNRVTRFVGNRITVLADPDHETTAVFDLFTTYIVDREGVVRVALPGTKAARARTDVVLAALARLQGAEPPVVSYERGALTVETAAPGDTSDTTDVLSTSWVRSHDALPAGDSIKLIVWPRVATGWHVFAHDEENMSPFDMTVDLPEGLSLADPVRYPTPLHAHDELLELDLSWYEDDIPLSALVIRASENMDPGEVTIGVEFTWQACHGETCLLPTTTRIEIPVRITAAGSSRGQLYGWQGW